MSHPFTHRHLRHLPTFGYPFLRVSPASTRFKSRLMRRPKSASYSHRRGRRGNARISPTSCYARRDFEVSMTGNPAAVLQLLLTARFDALLLDNWMPRINGTELCPNDPISRSKLPIFFWPGAVTEGDKKVAFEASAQGYFGRPFDPHEITITLSAAVKIQPTWTTFLRSVFTSLMPRSHPYTFRAPIVSDQPFRVFYPKLASALMFTLGHFVLPFFVANRLRQ